MHGAFTAEINLEATPASSLVDAALHGPAELILAEIDERLGLLHGARRFEVRAERPVPALRPFRG